MRSIGTVLKEARLHQGFSLEVLEDKTKIKKSFLKAIEFEQWEKLPAYPVVTGFIKSIASNLGVDREKAVAFLRRDYPPEKQSVSPKRDLSIGWRWGPKVTFALGIAVIVLGVVGYLGAQYLEFRQPWQA